ncbi:hypothetical protein CMUS01_04981 [Colletotrichum musicola]|uniref:Uncharacterized protein n=1 Tax=Colletotrichum musicola TaxID=2175873 RepID=A0A8H6NM76_9PEZI|nr:hypothetical protein CMUS01_04981 [Colletotrichum musicola]
MEGLRAAAVKGLFLTLRGLWLFLDSVGTQPTRQDVKQGLSLNLAGEGGHPASKQVDGGVGVVVMAPQGEVLDVIRT